MSVWSAAAVDNLRCVAEALEADIANGPLVPDVSPRAIREHLASRYSFAAPMALGDAVADVERMLREWHVQVTHPRYLGLFNPSVTFASIVGDAMAAMFNPQLATWRTSPAANAIERHTLGWLAGTLGLPPDVHATFTTGGAEANLSAVVVALTRACPEYGERGVSALPAPPSLYLTDGAHDSFRKIAHMTGVGREALRTVAMDADFRMDLTDLARQVSHDRRTGRQPLLVIGTAGTTSAGAIDPLADLAAFCRRERLWFHVDAAWGGAAVLSPRLRPHLAGIDAADSITCDAHKWFSVPMSAGMFFCRHVDAVRDAFRVQTAYMPGTTGGVDDPYTTTVQWSRRFIGLKLFLAIAERGEAGYAALIERQARLGDLLRVALEGAGWRIVNRTPLPLVCFTRDGLDASRLLRDVYARQVAWMSEVRLGGGEPVVRACVTSFHTTESDIERMVGETTRLAAPACEVNA